MVTSVLQLEQAAELLDNRDDLEIINEVMMIQLHFFRTMVSPIFLFR